MLRLMDLFLKLTNNKSCLKEKLAKHKICLKENLKKKNRPVFFPDSLNERFEISAL